MRSSTMTRRRWLVGASSATLALPALEYFMPRRAAAKALPPRLLVFYMPNGRRPEWWVPSLDNNNGLVFPEPAAALQPFADQTLSLVNLANDAARASPGAAHAMGTGTVMTGTAVPDIGGGVLHGNVTLDQLIVQQTAPETRFSSLQWSPAEPGPCDVGGASCSYTQSISWTGPASPIVPTIDPRRAFDRLFGKGVDGLDGAAADIRRNSMKLSVDYVRDDAAALQARLGHADQMRLDEYFTALTELEKSFTTAEDCDAALVPPAGALPYPERASAFNQLIKLAFQCDQTRVLSYMIEFGLSGRSHDFLDAPGVHHALSHFNNDTGRERLRKIETWQAQQLAELLQLLRDTQGLSGGTLLDETIVLAIPSMGAGSNHDHLRNCPMLFGGKGVIAADGRQIAFPSNDPHPLPNLHVSLLEANGIEGAFGNNGAIFGDDGTASIPGIVV